MPKHRFPGFDPALSPFAVTGEGWPPGLSCQYRVTGAVLKRLCLKSGKKVYIYASQMLVYE